MAETAGIRVDAWARRVAFEADVREDVARRALERVLPEVTSPAYPGEGPRRRARRARRLLAEAVAEAKRLNARMVSEVVRLWPGHDPRLSEWYARELYDAILAEVPEVSEGVVRVVRLVRARGLGAKAAVAGRLPGRANEGVLIGVGGARQRAIRSRVGGERLDVVTFQPDPAAFALAALRPGKVLEAWEERRGSVTVTCEPEAMAGVIGAEGLNVLLAGALVRARITAVPASSGDA